MLYVLAIAGGLLLAAAVLVVLLIAKGPTSFDRIIGLDMMSTIVVGVLALVAAATRRTDLLPIFVVMSIVGFIGSTSFGRFSQPLPAALRMRLRQQALKRRQKAEAQSGDGDCGPEDGAQTREPNCVGEGGVQQ